MEITLIILLFIISYLLGSIPGGYLIMKITRKEDIRNYGSKSTGATNTTRILGFKLGLLAGLIDVTKGMIVPIVITFVASLASSKLNGLIDRNNFNLIAYYGLAAVIGHIYPIFLGFRGGKAVATSLGVALFLNPYIAILGVLVFILVAKLSNYVSLSSMIAALFIGVFAHLQFIFGFNILGRKPLDLESVIAIYICVLIIIYRHIPNIKRMIKGEENKVSDLKNR